MRDLQSYREEVLRACPGRSVSFQAHTWANDFGGGRVDRRTEFIAAILPGFDGSPCQCFYGSVPEEAVAQAVAASYGPGDESIIAPPEPQAASDGPNAETLTEDGSTAPGAGLWHPYD